MTRMSGTDRDRPGMFDETLRVVLGRRGHDGG
jgi:hypothetical protein